MDIVIARSILELLIENWLMSIVVLLSIVDTWKNTVRTLGSAGRNIRTLKGGNSMTRVEENNEVIEMLWQLADVVNVSKSATKEDSYRLGLTTISTTLMDISKSLAIIADSLSERKE